LSGVGHQFRWHANNPFTRCEQIGLEAPRQPSAIFDCPLSVRSELVGPAEQSEVLDRGRASGCLLGDLSAQLVDSNNGVAALVCVDAKRHHGEELLFVSWKGAQDRSDGRTSVEGVQPTLLSSHAGRSVACPAGRQKGLTPRRQDSGEPTRPDTPTISLTESGTRSAETLTGRRFAVRMRPPGPYFDHVQLLTESRIRA
jgi:hypothetical protein